MEQIVGFFFGIIFGAVHWLQTAFPGGFGLLVIPVGILGIIAILAARNR